MNRHGAQDVASACTAKRYGKHTTAYFSVGADAAAGLARGDGGQLHEALSRVDRIHHAQLQAALARATRTGPMPRQCPSDFLQQHRVLRARVQVAPSPV